jgi:ubiquinone/menaquinone biosynthesis C-methylase UbiE
VLVASCDQVIDFTGLEDVQMTKGESGVQQALFGVNRVLKPNCYFYFAEMFSDKMETEAQKIEMALFSYICRRKALSSKEYKAIIKKAKFTPQQAKREIQHVTPTLKSLKS